MSKEQEGKDESMKMIIVWIVRIFVCWLLLLSILIVSGGVKLSVEYKGNHLLQFGGE